MLGTTSCCHCLLGVLNIHDVMFAHDVPAYIATSKCRVLNDSCQHMNVWHVKCRCLFVCSRAADVLLAGSVMNRVFQPHESHIPYILQASLATTTATAITPV